MQARDATLARRMKARGLGALALLACVLAPWPLLADSARSAGPARRIVSINLCTDQILVHLVGRDRIAALSHLARDSQLSPVVADAAGIASVHGSAEEVLALAPDLVLTAEYSTPQVVALLNRLGVRVEVVPLASDLEGIRVAIRRVAAAVGEPERGDELIRAFDARLDAVRPGGGARPTALAYQVNSLSAGAGGLIDAMLNTAGFLNMASEMKLGPAGRVPLESFIARPPDLVVLANAPDAFRSVSADNLRHPALRDQMRRRPHAELGMPLWLCGSPAVAGGRGRLVAAGAAIAGSVGAAGTQDTANVPARLDLHASPARAMP